MNTISSVYIETQVLLGKHKIKSAVYIRLLTQTIEAPKKRTLRVRNTEEERVQKDNSEKKQKTSCRSPMWFKTVWASHNHLQYKINFALNVA